ncbi:MAG: hypothetical protein H6Q33_2654 [Deltaproteobacteria bacterium]|nr:hypothetical protein [Deltaproteobacteria bacterium]
MGNLPEDPDWDVDQRNHDRSRYASGHNGPRGFYLKEIAIALGYTDLFHLHLSKTFKRLVGIAPRRFREHHRKVT